MLLNNRWVRAGGSLREKPISIQFREDWQSAMDSGLYGVCVQIAWNAESRDDSSGFPSTDEQARILAFTEQLQLVLEKQADSVVAMMITHDGINQWIIYTRDLDVLKKHLDEVPTTNGLYPIEVVADEDKAWDTFVQVHNRIVNEEP